MYQTAEEQKTLLKRYLDQNFPRPTDKTFTWWYSPRDMIDEAILFLGGLLFFAALGNLQGIDVPMELETIITLLGATPFVVYLVWLLLTLIWRYLDVTKLPEKMGIFSNTVERVAQEKNKRDLQGEFMVCAISIAILAGIWAIHWFGLFNWMQLPNALIFPKLAWPIVILGKLGFTIYGVVIFGVLLFRRRFMEYELTQDYFQFTHGLFNQKIESFQLADVIQVTLRQSVWQWLIRTGTIKIRFKTTTGLNEPLVIQGIHKYQEMFEQIDYYRNRHRLVLYFGI